jgi:hypothetical protein
MSTATSEFDIIEDDLNLIIDKYTHFNRIIVSEKLDSIHLVKPLLDGKQICELYGIKPGKAIKFIMDEELKYQIIHPEDQYGEVEEFLRINKDEFLKKYN